MLNRLLLASVLSTGISLGAVSGAFALANNDHADDAPGQVNATANCAATSLRLDAMGVTGENTGNNAHDPKSGLVFPGGVNNCDHFWVPD